jgi:hypothetical protein
VPNPGVGVLLDWLLLNKNGEVVDGFDPLGAEGNPLIGALKPKTGVLGAALGWAD